ncbi:MAG: prepilin-type N-terminal cleavage/methylation domain-containing protein [Capsulimonadales bacterium]|nr:prepilin-type N-terminal cleavage/methylation domain-containing protein [Capsulimonadales bacterium]
MSGKRRLGFTLIELMIVILILAILIGMASTNMIRARATAAATSCIANLKQITTAKEQWAMENRKTATDTVTLADLTTGPENARYLHGSVTCPSGGNYTIGNVDTLPTCSITTPIPHVLP